MSLPDQVPSRQELLGVIDAAFAGMVKPTVVVDSPMLADPESEESMVVDFFGRRDADNLTLDDLVQNLPTSHPAGIFFMTTEALAYFLASLMKMTLVDDDDPNRAWAYELCAILAFELTGENAVDSPGRVREVARVLSPGQRAAVTKYLRYIADRYRNDMTTTDFTRGIQIFGDGEASPESDI